MLVPIVDRPGGLTVLLTERAAELRRHPGQISFPGGHLEPADQDPVAAALRETEEEIGLPRAQVEVLGFLNDQLMLTGYRVTPVVGLVRPPFTLVLDPREVASTFELPLAVVLDPHHHQRRTRTLGGREIELIELAHGPHRIWGATAGMLIDLYQLLTDTAGD